MLVAFLLSCVSNTIPKLAPIEPNEELSGGRGTVFDRSDKAYALSFRGLNKRQRRAFAVGNAFFNDNWVTAPASTEGRDGLGPLFNAHSCSSCHFRDGRAAPPRENNDSVGLLLRLRIGDDGAPIPDPNYGGQIQDGAIATVDPEAKINITLSEIHGTFGDGEPYVLFAPTYELIDLRYGELHPDLRISPRVAPSVFGNGLLEAIPTSTLYQLADPDDEDQDGISGKVNLIDGTVGRFGWKASVPSIEEQTAGAFLGDIGITSPLHPEHSFSESQQDLYQKPTGGSPEIDQHKLDRIVEYIQLLAVPARRDWTDATVRRGKQIFHDIQCASCHIPSLHTDSSHPVPALHDQVIHPYTDLLLHDMGHALADNFADHDATGKEWRTPPLWGLGLLETVNEHNYLLHDGRARNVTEAILWHGGEAERSKEAFRNLSKEEREALLSFLFSL